VTPVRVLPYTDEHRRAWDELVGRSRNGTFLFQRDYMEYHRDRFTDCSRILEEDGRPLALFPANRAGDVVSSHGGLTYGGLVVDEAFKTPIAVMALHALCRSLAEDGVRRIKYKTVPWFYHRGPTEEDRYALHMAGAVVMRRDVTSVVDPRHPIAFQERRRRSARKAAKAGLVARASDDLPAYWALLSENLQARFGRAPVHTLAEIQRLQGLFPAQIRLHASYEGADMRAGVLVYETDTTAHVQYISADERGKQLGALDLLFEHLLGEVFRAKPYFDFGTSMEEDGRGVNRGLIDQKEGFGARAVVQDHYELDPAAGAERLEQSGMLA
jgi:hypothetical protein